MKDYNMKVDYKIGNNGKPKVNFSREESGTNFNRVTRSSFSYNKTILSLIETKINNPVPIDKRGFIMSLKQIGSHKNTGEYKYAQMALKEEELIYIRDNINKILSYPKKEEEKIEQYKNINYINTNVKLKPPLGIIPKYILDAQRIEDLKGAIDRYCSANLQIPSEWIEEYNSLIKLSKKEG